MASLVLAVAYLILDRTSAGLINRSPRIHGTCQQLDIPVFASSPGAVFDTPQVNNDLDTVVWALDADSWSTPKGPQAIIENITIAGTYSIHAQLCLPTSQSHSNKSDMLQIATHGLYYDARYWDPELDRGKNSYVEAAIKAGYPILTYDRLGTGQSDKPNAYTTVQASFELEILHQLTLMARNGTLNALAAAANPSDKAFQSLAPPTKIIHIGHSYGSFLTSAYITTHGSFSDAAIITGYVPNKQLGTVGATSFNLQYAAHSSPAVSKSPSGYIVPSKQGIQTIFFGGDPQTAFTQEMLDYGDSIKQPIAVAEYTSSYSLLLAQGGDDFKGPVQYMVPEFDFFVCHGDCKNTYSEEGLRGMFPNATAVQVDVQPNTGHGLTFHKNATEGYQVTFDFLSQHGL